MSKYTPLTERLAGHGDDEWRASFAELEEVLGFPLPKGARAGTNWWANDAEKAHSRAWTAPGWAVAEVDRAAESVTFRRNMAQAGIEAAETDAAAETIQPEPMRQAAQTASRDSRVRKAAPAVAAGVAVLAGVAAFAARRLMQRRAAS
jgi:hypothetical protein